MLTNWATFDQHLLPDWCWWWLPILKLWLRIMLKVTGYRVFNNGRSSAEQSKDVCRLRGSSYMFTDGYTWSPQWKLSRYTARWSSSPPNIWEFFREISRNDPTPSLIFEFEVFLSNTGDCGSMTVAWSVIGNNFNLSFFWIEIHPSSWNVVNEANTTYRR